MKHSSRFFFPLASVALGATLILGQVGQAAPAEQRTLVLRVDDDAGPGGRGTIGRPYDDLADAVDRAREQAASYDSVLILVAPGEYLIKKPIRIDFPVEIRGSNVTELALDGWPSDTAQIGSDTRIIAADCLTVGETSLPLITIEGTSEKPVDAVTLRNLTLQGFSPACSLLKIAYAADLLVADNILTGPGQTGIDAAAVSGSIIGNHVSGLGLCGICIAAGTEFSPAVVTIADNRSVGNTSGGLLLGGTAFPLTEYGDQLVASVLHNDLSLNQAGAALGFGLRILALGTIVPPDQKRGRVTADIRDNKIDGNRNSVMIDAGFPTRILDESCDKRVFEAEFALTFSGNSITGEPARDTLLSFTRGQALTAPAKNPLSRWQYLHSATIAIEDADQTLGLLYAGYVKDDLILPPTAAVIDHPMYDRFVGGECDDDIVKEELSNTLIYNGVIIPATVD